MAKATNVERRACAVCVELSRATGIGQMQYRTVVPIALAAGVEITHADEAIAHAVKKGWLVTEIAKDEMSRSICLTDEGRMMVGFILRRALAQR
jgi:hypothetical protein